jgi:general secretion pathway protein B
MSYILEALKKAQAERQLGGAPTIHTAAPVHAAPRTTAANRKPLLIGLAGGVLIASAAAIVAWQQRGTPGAEVRAPAHDSAPPAAAAPAPLRVVIEPAAPQPARVAGKAAEPARPVQRAATPARASHPSTPVRQDAPQPVREAYAPAPVPNPAPAAAPAGDNVRTLAELPESIQREVPRVAVGGYIYSSNPADRLLLVDKMLRHEGEQLAPGLVLEKLLPKGAVMNYKGYRYRVAY